MFTLGTVLTVTVAALLIVGIFNERKLVAFEDAVIASLKKRLRALCENRNTYHRERNSGNSWTHVA